jgi:hypothetical protein
MDHKINKIDTVRISARGGAVG